MRTKKPQKISAGIEPLAKSIRIWWRIDGIRHRETLFIAPTDDNITHAKHLAQLIITQLQLGIFKRDEFFPTSPKRADVYFDFWCEKYKDSLTDVAPSSRSSYLSKLQHHVEPYWRQTAMATINYDDAQQWVNTLKLRLSTKTIRDIVMLFHHVWSLWARHEPNPVNPTQYIRLKSADSEDIDPFTKDEIRRIIDGESDPMYKNLWTVMLWTGLSAHEVLPLAVEDLDSVQGLYVRRGFVKGVLKATKNRRRKRIVQLLPIALNALQDQIGRTQHTPCTVDILQRDNQTYRSATLTWLWHNPKTDSHYTYASVSGRWYKHLKHLGIRGRGLNHGRHTYASQVLSTGAVSAEWLANQLGHSNTQMIHKHYGKFMPTHSTHFIDKLSHALDEK